MIRFVFTRRTKLTHPPKYDELRYLIHRIRMTGILQCGLGLVDIRCRTVVMHCFDWGGRIIIGYAGCSCGYDLRYSQYTAGYRFCLISQGRIGFRLF